MIKQIFITGTDTDIGKTFVTLGLSLLTQNLGFKAGVIKPFQSGAKEKNLNILNEVDINFIKKYSNGINTKTTYLLKAPTAPSLAACLDNVKIDLDFAKKDIENFSKLNDITFIEGSGGICVPIDDKHLISDFIKMLDIPTIIVARSDLGTINHTILTFEYAKRMNLNVLGVIINKFPNETNDLSIIHLEKEFKQHLDTKILGIIPEIDKNNMCNKTIIELFKKNIDLNFIYEQK